jgi:hypothetical protein
MIPFPWPWRPSGQCSTMAESCCGRRGQRRQVVDSSASIPTFVMSTREASATSRRRHLEARMSTPTLESASPRSFHPQFKCGQGQGGGAFGSRTHLPAGKPRLPGITCTPAAGPRVVSDNSEAEEAAEKKDAERWWTNPSADQIPMRKVTSQVGWPILSHGISSGLEAPFTYPHGWCSLWLDRPCMH